MSSLVAIVLGVGSPALAADAEPLTIEAQLVSVVRSNIGEVKATDAEIEAAIRSSTWTTAASSRRSSCRSPR